MKKRKTRKKFLPYFQPAYVEVIGVDDQGIYHAMRIVKPIQYNSSLIRVYVRVP